MYVCSIWYIQGGRGFTGAQRAAEQAIRSIQDQALHRISGAFKRTSRQAQEGSWRESTRHWKSYSEDSHAATTHTKPRSTQIMKPRYAPRASQGGPLGACQAWTASLLDNQRANEDDVAAAQRIMMGLEFGVDLTINK
ncbi:hypothetical protein TSTA_126550 [Talaromyces stipitatus ATCC 10500]|uniref:Uncharacterized protein n=1 Tax=Talaromyces stipitatus (strain ATCC 10500 / CBS 375.48 / QM 6759 / NRRL 1006) TaxID=441959 RepID=B8MCP5_TALSN|nr:uncharacterized protein TSTA_126550 [Talaromyces stipitatus ATCC 10500]EED18947.1 hypothetical protein TSTA_126550 [Talaromyces stipitatus ATCC 10500]